MACHWSEALFIVICSLTFAWIAIYLASNSHLTLKNIGYENFVVAIHEDISPDPQFMTEFQTGLWTFIQTRSRNSCQVPVAVRSEPLIGQDALEVNSWFGNQDTSISTTNVIHSHVHIDYAPVIDAVVQGTIERSDGCVLCIMRWDDEEGSDIFENGGANSGSFSDYSANDRYQVDAQIFSLPYETAFIQLQTKTGAAPIFWNYTPPVTHVSTGNFSRTSTAGAIDVKGYTGQDLIAPGKVDDLDVVSHDCVQNTVNLTWTSPGDDDYSGIVTRYELRIGMDTSDLRANFTDCISVTDAMLAAGDLQPKPSRTPHAVSVRLPATWTGDDYVFGIKAFDESDQSSALSNLKTVTCKPVHINNAVVSTYTVPTITGKSASGEGDNSAIIAGAAAGGCLALVIAVIVFAVYRYKKTNRLKPEDEIIKSFSQQTPQASTAARPALKINRVYVPEI